MTDIIDFTTKKSEKVIGQDDDSSLGSRPAKEVAGIVSKEDSEFNVDRVIIIGTTTEGRIYFDTNFTRPGDVMWYLERIKGLLLTS